MKRQGASPLISVQTLSSPDSLQCSATSTRLRQDWQKVTPAAERWPDRILLSPLNLLAGSNAGDKSCAICSDYAEFPQNRGSAGPIKDSSVGLCPHDGWFFGNSLEIMIECESIDRSNAQNRQSPLRETGRVIGQGLDSKS